MELKKNRQSENYKKTQDDETFEELIKRIINEVNENIGIEYNDNMRKQVREYIMEDKYFKSPEKELFEILYNKGIEILANFSLPKEIEFRRKDYFVLKETEKNKEKVREFKKKYGL